MNESLEQMVTNYRPEDENEEENQEQENQEVNENNNDNNEQPQEETPSQEGQVNEISITNLTTWFRNNVRNFNNIFSVDANLRGVDPNKNLIMTVKDDLDPSGETRYPCVFRGSDGIFVLDLPGYEMFIYQNNTFQINYRYSNDIFIKTYNLKRGIGVVFCLYDSSGNPVPVKIDKYKKINQTRIPVDENITNIPLEQILDQTADIETLIIKYKQIQKSRNELNTNRDVLNYFINKKQKIFDINHLIQIDTIIASIFE